MDSILKMDRFIETYNLPRLHYEEPENMKIPMSSKEIEPVIKTSNKEKPRMSSLENSPKFTPIILKFFQKIDKEGTLIF